jgi:hypothetical protein
MNFPIFFLAILTQSSTSADRQFFPFEKFPAQGTRTFSFVPHGITVSFDI